MEQYSSNVEINNALNTLFEQGVTAVVLYLGTDVNTYTKK